MGPYETYARKHGRLHPDNVAVLQPFFTPLRFDVHSVRIRIVPAWFGSLGARGSPTAMAVFASTWYVIPGVLDADGVVRGNVWSWTRYQGVANYAHEAFHVYQYYRDGFVRLYGLFAWGILRSLMTGKLYDHTKIVPEMEAIAFERQIEEQLPDTS